MMRDDGYGDGQELGNRRTEGWIGAEKRTLRQRRGSYGWRYLGSVDYCIACTIACRSGFVDCNFGMHKRDRRLKGYQ